MLNYMNEKWVSKSHNVKVKNYPGAVSEDILYKIDDSLKVKADCLLVHVETNGLTNNMNLLNSFKKMIKKLKNSSPNTNLVFSSVILRKDKKDILKKVGETKQWLKNYCKQKNIDFVDNSNIIEEHVGSKKLHLYKRRNSILAKIILKYLRDSYWNDDLLNCGMKYDECKSKLPSISVNSISVRNIRDVRKINLKCIILGHLNINSIRNKFNKLVDQIKGNADITIISETKLDDSFLNGQFKIPRYA